MNDEKGKSDYTNFLKMVEKIDEEKKKKEEEANPRKIGDMTVGELKSLIRSTMKEEEISGDLPLLNNTQKKKLTRWFWIIVAIFLIGGIAYRSIWFETEFRIKVNKDRLFISKERGWTSETKEIKVKDEKWQ